MQVDELGFAIKSRFRRAQTRNRFEEMIGELLVMRCAKFQRGHFPILIDSPRLFFPIPLLAHFHSWLRPMAKNEFAKSQRNPKKSERKKNKGNGIVFRILPSPPLSPQKMGWAATVHDHGASQPEPYVWKIFV